MTGSFIKISVVNNHQMAFPFLNQCNGNIFKGFELLLAEKSSLHIFFDPCKIREETQVVVFVNNCQLNLLLYRTFIFRHIFSFKCLSVGPDCSLQCSVKKQGVISNCWKVYVQQEADRQHVVHITHIICIRVVQERKWLKCLGGSLFHLLFTRWHKMIRQGNMT